MESMLENALNEIAEKNNAQVFLETVRIEGKLFTEYVIGKKRFSGLGRTVLARAYIEHGFDNETGEYTEITVAKVPEIADGDFSHLKQMVSVPVNLEDYATAKKFNFNRRLGGP